MGVKTTKMTELCGDWGGNFPDQKDIQRLNEDFEEMGINLSTILTSSPDGWTLKFVYTEEE